jgi:hypothetical protein
MTGRPLVDTRTYDLAARFLEEVPGSTEDDVWALAGDLQTLCEDACRAVGQRQARPSTDARPPAPEEEP